jgi:hypothetical protein
VIGVALDEAHPERVEQDDGDAVGALRRPGQRQAAGGAGEEPLDGRRQRCEACWHLARKGVTSQ